MIKVILYPNYVQMLFLWFMLPDGWKKKHLPRIYTDTMYSW